MNILDEYVLTAPSLQNMIDLFKGEWSSKLPDEFGVKTEPGRAGLFEDPRVYWADNVFGGVKDFKILELGPLEGGHSYIFQKLGARQIRAIEANSRGFLKCLCIKEALKLDRVEFCLGDFVAYLKESSERYDLVFASGVLYHMREPVELIKLMGAAADRIFIWTQYYDQNVINARPDLQKKFDVPKTFIYEDVEYEGVTQSYNDALEWSGFCGGPASTSRWLTRESLLRALATYGFFDVQINFDDLNHPNGPAIALCARRIPGAQS